MRIRPRVTTYAKQYARKHHTIQVAAYLMGRSYQGDNLPSILGLMVPTRL